MLRKYLYILVGWTVLVGSSWLWNQQQLEYFTLNNAVSFARASLAKDIGLRGWVASHGGVYVQPSVHTPPNPYLQVPDSDVVTSTGMRLTLMNPAFVMREVQGDFNGSKEDLGHVTSLRLLNPGNKPDAWEIKALKSFEQGAQEMLEIADIGDKTYLRLMKPLPVTEGCLKCHASQGYKAGGVGGGLGAYILLQPFRDLQLKRVHELLLTHGVTWLIGLLGWAWVFGRERSSLIERKQAEQMGQFRTHILELLASDEPLSNVLNTIVLSVENITPGALCTILLLDDQGKHLLTGAAPSLPDFYNAAVNGVEIGVGVGSCGTAAFTGERVIAEDIQSHPYWTPYKELAARAKLGSCWSQPIRSSTQKVLGTFAIYHRHAHTPDTDDIDLIEQSARLASIAIEKLQATEKLIRSEQRFHSFFERNTSVMLLINPEAGRIEDANIAASDYYGHRIEQLIGMNISEINTLSPKHLTEEMQLALHQQRGHFIFQHRLASGEVRDVEVRSTPIETADRPMLFSIIVDITEQKAAATEIHNLAFFDTLTQLPNRRLLVDTLKSSLLTSVKSRRYGAVLFVDLDDFKKLNDTLSHEYGDLLLIEVARRIRSCLGEVGTVARFGGDDFVVLLEEVDDQVEQATQKVTLIAEKIRVTLIEPYRLNGMQYLSSASIGVSLYQGDGVTASDVLTHADMAMYRAKGAGRNAVRVFDAEMQLAVVTHTLLEADLRRAVPEQQLELYYQIQVNSDHQTIGAEALVRWHHPTRGMVSPAQFIPLAEESSLILDVGGWVMDTACRQLAEWAKSERTRHLTLAVNVSAKQFKQPDFVDNLKDLLYLYELDPSRLKIELTESVVLNDLAEVIAKMHALKALKVRLAMDDFGTGYSSLSYLKKLPLDQLKIDQSFVRDLTSDHNDVVMVQTIVDMAKNFHLNVIAEGVETEAQLILLKHLGCMFYQGYFFSKPMPIEQLERLLDQ
ncbi:MAG: diguanylate cyclase (GGDEF)-like protein/PAS domain S-box-containing protein [Motiliproteus sp.]|jgi:diguanylate cyclase (GGDEF)-like protein/PAS domain S-box-containing protein